MTECKEHQDWVKATNKHTNEAFHLAHRLETEPHSRVFHADVKKALAKAKTEGEIVGLRRAIELVLEVGTGYSDRTKNITDHIEGHIRVLERGASDSA